MKWGRIFRFASVGVANTAIDFGTFNLLLHLGVARGIANVAGIGLALCFSYVANSRWTFRGGHDGWRTALPFVAVTGIGMGINTALVVLLGDPARFPGVGLVLFLGDPARFPGIAGPGVLVLTAALLVPNIAKILASVFSLTWNYLGYAKFVFRGAPAGRGGNGGGEAQDRD